MSQTKYAGESPEPPDESHPRAAARLKREHRQEALRSLPDLYGRMLEIESALCAALETRGHEAGAGLATINGEQIKFWTYEASYQRRVLLTPKDFFYRAGEDRSRQVLIPSGQPTLVAMPMPHGGERRWTDKPGKPVERQIDRIVSRFEAIAKSMIADRARMEEYHRELEVLMRKAARRWHKELERKAKPKRLRSFVAKWHEAQQMRAFLDALEEQELNHPLPEALADWMDWARDYADAIDPFSEQGMAAIHAHADTISPGPEDDEEPDPDEMEWRHLGMLDEFM